MRMTFAITVFCAVAAFICGAAPLEEGERSFNVNDDFTIVGKCRVPLGTPFKAVVQTIGGKYVVTAVNGRQLASPVSFDEHFGVDNLEETVWAWESGIVSDASKEVNRTVNRVLTCQSVLCTQRIREMDPEPPEPSISLPTISVGEIGTDVEIRGVCGKPMGEWLQIEGTWHFDDSAGKGQDYYWHFRLTRVNNLPCEGIELLLMDVRPYVEGPEVVPSEGQVWRMHAYESFAYFGTSSDLQTIRGRLASWRKFGRYPCLLWKKLEVLR